jgi:hypothetical protein
MAGFLESETDRFADHIQGDHDEERPSNAFQSAGLQRMGQVGAVRCCEQRHRDDYDKGWDIDQPERVERTGCNLKESETDHRRYADREAKTGGGLPPPAGLSRYAAS